MGTSTLRAALAAALAASEPGTCLGPYLPSPPAGRVVVVGAGKAAAAMARAVEAGFEADVPMTGAVVTRYGHALPTRRVAVLEGSHPVPDAAGVAATARIRRLVADADETDLIICLISGGGSALLCAPAGLGLAEKAETTAALLRGGADIRRINTVRKHLSAVKGGRLAAAARAPMLTLAVSDVVGDDPATIASGPTVADASTFAEALDVLHEFAPTAAAARRAVQAGLRGERQETPKPGDPRLATARYELVASGPLAVRAAAARLRADGVVVAVEDAAVTGDSVAVGRRQAREVAAALDRGAWAGPVAFVYGGETTVERSAPEPPVRGPGAGEQLNGGAPLTDEAGPGGGASSGRGRATGGPNGEWALAFAAELGRSDYWLLAIDTDGIDGASAAAGALLDPAALGRLTPARIERSLAAHDSHGLLGAVGGLLVTGPTRTNVNALRIVLFPHPHGGGDGTRPA